MIEGTVKLNGYWYNLASKVVGAYHSRLPGKVNTGPDDFDKENFLSNWIISDQRGGIGVDEMDESIHADRNWWTNCITDFDGHITLPRLATVIPVDAPAAPTISNAGFETWTAGVPDNWTYTAAPGSNMSMSVNDDSAVFQAGAHSARVDFVFSGPASDGGNAYLEYTISTPTAYIGHTIKFTVYNKATVLDPEQLSDVEIRIYRNAANVASVAFSAATHDWAQNAAVSYEVPTGTTSLTIRLYQGYDLFASATTAGTTSIYWDVVASDITNLALGTPVKMADFNSKLYLGTSTGMFYLKSDRTEWMALKSFTGITTIFTGPNNNLLVFVGDSTNYWYMSTADAFTQTNVNDATRGILWDSKAWKMDADGNWWHSTDADNSATPTWTSKAGITDVPTQIERLEVGKDGDGDPVIYCSTNSWLKVYDFTNNKWINTEVKLYGNQYHGQGFIYWNNAHYLSYGIGVKSYTVGSTGTLSDVGLNRDGGLPTEYNGIIPRLIDGGDQLFALVDSSLTSGNSQSGLYAFTGRAWKCWWADANNNGVMHDAIVSSAQSAYAVYFDCGGSIYYIDMPEGLSNPKYLVGTQKYATSGIFLSPWFDGGNQAFGKLSKAVVSYAKGITTTETIAIEYRTDKTNTDRDTGWTTIETLNTTAENGENKEQIASGAGTAFNTFQFRLDFARGSTTTLSPDMLALVLGHRLITQGNWSWTQTLLIDNSLNTSAAQKWANLESAIESETDVPFIFRYEPDETHYVSFINPREIMVAGKEFAGEINIQLLESWLP